MKLNIHQGAEDILWKMFAGMLVYSVNLRRLSTAPNLSHILRIWVAKNIYT